MAPRGGAGSGFRNVVTVLAEHLYVVADGLTDQIFRFFRSATGRDAARQIRYVGAVAVAGPLDDHDVVGR